MPTLLLIIGFIILIKGADYLVEGASSFAARMSISDIAIGLTIVSFGTSAPELVINIFASIQGRPDISFGNIIGSSIINILLILGIAGIIHPIKTEKNTVWKEIPFALLAAVILLVLCNDVVYGGKSNVLSRIDGVILIVFFILFIIYTFAIPKVESRHGPEIRTLPVFKIVVFILTGAAGLFLGGKLVVDNAVIIAHDFGMSDRLIGFTVMAVGTSLPELFTSAVAAYKGKTDIAIGNVVGSNIFNIFLVLGVSALIAPLPFQLVLNLDITVLIVVSTLLFVTMFTGKNRLLDRWEAVIFVILYAGYTLFLVLRN